MLEFILKNFVSRRRFYLQTRKIEVSLVLIFLCSWLTWTYVHLEYTGEWSQWFTISSCETIRIFAYKEDEGKGEEESKLIYFFFKCFTFRCFQETHSVDTRHPPNKYDEVNLLKGFWDILHSLQFTWIWMRTFLSLNIKHLPTSRFNAFGVFYSLEKQFMLE